MMNEQNAAAVAVAAAAPSLSAAPTVPGVQDELVQFGRDALVQYGVGYNAGYNGIVNTAMNHIKNSTSSSITVQDALLQFGHDALVQFGVGFNNGFAVVTSSIANSIASTINIKNSSSTTLADELHNNSNEADYPAATAPFTVPDLADDRDVLVQYGLRDTHAFVNAIVKIAEKHAHETQQTSLSSLSTTKRAEEQLHQLLDSVGMDEADTTMKERRDLSKTTPWIDELKAADKELLTHYEELATYYEEKATHYEELATHYKTKCVTAQSNCEKWKDLADTYRLERNALHAKVLKLEKALAERDASV